MTQAIMHCYLVRELTEKSNVGYLHLQKEFQITSEESYCLNFYYYNLGQLVFRKFKSLLHWFQVNLKPFKRSGQVQSSGTNTCKFNIDRIALVL